MAVLYEESGCTIVNLKNGVAVPVPVGDELCAAHSGPGCFNLLSRYMVLN